MIKNIESKIRINFFVSIAAILFSGVVCIAAVYMSLKNSDAKDQRIYVLDNGIPILLKRTNMAENRMAEYKSHVAMFHQLFFTIPPDDDFVKKNIESAMYLIDNTGLKEYQNLVERDYYGQIMASSASLSISTDSVVVNDLTKDFVFYGTQRVDRQSSVIIRKLITKGKLVDTYRSDVNPHGLRIEKWLTVENTDLKSFQKKTY